MLKIPLVMSDVEISIPTGTIKSVICKHHIQPLQLISIPTGTIKSAADIKNIESQIKFQFLLVRLKEEQAKYQTKMDKNFNSYWYD